MDFEIGDRVMRGGKGGRILASRKTPANVWMYEVRWDEDFHASWLPGSELRMWDKVQAPAPTPTTPWGRTTPLYLLGIRRTIRNHKNPQPNKYQRKADESKLANALLEIKGRKAKNKRKKLVNNFEAKYAAGKVPAWHYKDRP